MPFGTARRRREKVPRLSGSRVHGCSRVVWGGVASPSFAPMDAIDEPQTPLNDVESTWLSLFVYLCTIVYIDADFDASALFFRKCILHFCTLHFSALCKKRKCKNRLSEGVSRRDFRLGALRFCLGTPEIWGAFLEGGGFDTLLIKIILYIYQ